MHCFKLRFEIIGWCTNCLWNNRADWWCSTMSNKTIWFLCFEMVSCINMASFFLPRFIWIIFFSSEQVRGTADVFYLLPLNGNNLENSLWFTNEPLSATIIDQILNRLKLLPDFYNQTKPVETNSSSIGNNVVVSQMTATSTNIS